MTICWQQRNKQKNVSEMATRKREVRKKWMTIRFSQQEFEVLEALFAKATDRNISTYSRKALLKGPIYKGARNLSLDALIPEFSALLKTLNGAANNFNQAVHSLHLLAKEGKGQEWALRYDMDKRVLMLQIATMKELMTKASLLWLES
jgi:hypothetical protein